MKVGIWGPCVCVSVAICVIHCLLFQSADRFLWNLMCVVCTVCTHLQQRRQPNWNRCQIIPTLRVGRWRNQQGYLIFSLTKFPHRFWGPPCPLFNGCQGLFSKNKTAKREAYHWPPFIFKVKNMWSCTSAVYSNTAWRLIKHKDSFAFFLPVTTWRRQLARW